MQSTNGISKPNIEEMFNGIAHRYDFLNRLLSLGIDRAWRKKLVRIGATDTPERALDIATGTADLAIALARANKRVSITGVDISESMLEVGRRKVNKLKLESRITLAQAPAELLPFPANTFDIAMVAFGVRNFSSVEKGVSEIYRVLKPNCRLLVLEFTNPTNSVVRSLFGFYFHKVLPKVGRLISGHSSAYTYLPCSVQQFAERDQFLAILTRAGFTSTSYKPLTMGVAAIYQGVKSAE